MTTNRQRRTAMATVAVATAPRKPVPALERMTFKTSRLAEFCSRRELVAQTGHQVHDWPLVILKELTDTVGAGCHTWCKRMDFVRVVAGDKYIGQDTRESRRKPRQLARGIANLLDDPVSQEPVPNFCATLSRRMQKDDVPAASTRMVSPIETGTATSVM
jgi:hypothetical protein